MKQLLIFLLILGTLNNHAQDLKDSIRQTKKYYEFINLAERKIMDNNLVSAKWFYELAFLYGAKQANPRDLYNAFVTCYLSGDSVHAKQYFHKLISYGYQIEEMEQSVFIDSIKHQAFYQSYIAMDIAQNEFTYRMSSRKEKARFIDSLWDLDQAYRRTPDSFNYNADSFIVKKLVQHIEQYGIPDYSRTGATGGMGKLPYNSSNFCMILWHTRGDSTYLQHLLAEGVIKGLFPPDDFAFLMDHHRNQYWQMPANVLDSLNGEELLAINQRRAAINLCDLHTHFEKLTFQKSQPYFVFYYPINFIFMNSEKYREIFNGKMKLRN